VRIASIASFGEMGILRAARPSANTVSVARRTLIESSRMTPLTLPASAAIASYVLRDSALL